MTEPAPAQPSSFSVLTRAFKHAFRDLWPVLRSRAKLLVGLHVLAFLGEQYFRYAEEAASRRMSESLGLIATNAGLAISFDLFWHAAFFILAVQALADRERGLHTPPHDAFIRHFNQIVVENTRVIARVLFWLPFFVLPAVYQYLRLAFVGFVVVEDPGYELDRVDAIARSREISEGRAGLCLLAVLLSALAEPVLAGFVHGGEIAVWRNPVGAIFSLPVTLAVNVWTVIFMYSVFRGLSVVSPHARSTAMPPDFSVFQG